MREGNKRLKKESKISESIRLSRKQKVGEETIMRRTAGRRINVAVDSRVWASSSAGQTPLADISRESPNYCVPGKHLMPAPQHISHAGGKHRHETHSLTRLL